MNSQVESLSDGSGDSMESKGTKVCETDGESDDLPEPYSIQAPRASAITKKRRTPRRQMLDKDGYLKMAEDAYDKRAHSVMCPACRVVGQMVRDSVGQTRRFKCRAGQCNKTVGTKEFYLLSLRRSKELFNDSASQSVWREKEPHHLPRIPKSNDTESVAGSPSPSPSPSSPVSRSSTSSHSVYRHSQGTPLRTASRPVRKPLDASPPITASTLLGKPTPTNIGINVRGDERHPARNILTTLRGALKDDSLSARVQMLNVAENKQHAAMKCIQSLQRSEVVAPESMELVYVDMKFLGSTEIRNKLRLLNFDTDQIYTISKAWNAVEFLVTKFYLNEFVGRCEVCRFAIVDKRKMAPQSKSGSNALRKRFAYLIDQATHPNIQQFFRIKLQQLAEHCVTIKDNAKIKAQVANKVIDLQYLNVRSLSQYKHNLIINRLHSDTIFFAAETWFVDKEKRSAHPCFVASSIDARPPRHMPAYQRGRNGITAMAHRNLVHTISMVKQTEYVLAVEIAQTIICAIYFPPSLSLGELIREMQHIPQETDILLGDFNVSFGRSTDNQLQKAERRITLADFAAERGFTRIDPLTTQGKHHGLDHVFASKAQMIKNLHLLAAPFPTDHPLMTMKAALAQAPVENPSSERFWISRLQNERNTELFCQAFDEMMQGMCAPATIATHADTPSNADIELLDITLTAVIQCALELVVDCYFPSNSKHQQRKLGTNSHTMADILKAIKSSKRESGRMTPLKSQNTSLTPIQEAETHYTALFSSAREMIDEHAQDDIQTSTSTSTPPMDTRADEYKIIINQCDEPFSIQASDIVQAIKAYPDSKAPGLDGLDRRTLRCLCKSTMFIPLLTRLFHWCISCEYTPRRWNISLIHPIPKPGKDADFIANRRPVALTAIFRRIFEKIMLPFISGTDKYDKGQGGFRKGFSCMTQILLAEQCRKSGLIHQIFLDLESAYDRVLIYKLLPKLAENKLQPKVIKLVESLFTNCSSIIAVNGALSSNIPRTKGLFQGSLLSPDLFNWYINDLAVDLNRESEPGLPNCLLFADDIQLQSRSIEKGQHMLDTVGSWCRSNGMAVNTGKCGTFTSDARFHIDGQAIPIVDSYKYLGIPLGKTGIQLEALMKINLTKANNAFIFVSRNMCSSSWPPSVKLTLYKTFVRSIMEYGAALLVLMKTSPMTKAAKKTLNDGMAKMERLQIESLRWIFLKNTSHKSLQSLSSTPDLSLRFEELTARLRIHLLCLHPHHQLRLWERHQDTCSLVRSAYQYPFEGVMTTSNIKNTFRQKLLASLKEKSKLAAIIDDSCRTDMGIDSCLKIEHFRLRATAIAWRTNTFGHRAICSGCKMPFNRKHANTCYTHSIRGKMAKSFDQAKTSILYNHLVYTIFDHLLNERRYDLFQREIARLTFFIERHPASGSSEDER